MAGTAKLDLLRTNIFFDEFTDRQLLDFLPEIIQEDYGENHQILAEGDELDRIFFLITGSLRLEKEIAVYFDADHDESNLHVLEVITSGNHLGAAALLETCIMPAALVANSDCSLLSLSRNKFQQIITAENELATKMLLAVGKALASGAGDHLPRLEMEIKNRLLLERMRTEKKKITAIHRIAKSTAHSSVRETLDTILEACMECLAVEKGSVMIFQQGVLRVEAAFGADKNEIIGKVGEINEQSVSGRCFISRKPVLIEDISKEKNIKRAGAGKKYSNNSLLSMPLVSLSGEAIGVLNVSKTSAEIFSRADLAILEDLAQEAGAALAHEISLARLFQGFQQAYVGVKQAGEQLHGVEEDITRLLDMSWQQEEENN